MNECSTAPAIAMPATAWRAALARVRQRAPRLAGFVSALCVGIALLLTAIDGGGFGTKLVYSLCIGAACSGCVEGSRLAAAWASDRWRQSRRLPPAAGAFQGGWRGLLPGLLLAMLAGPPLGLWLGDRLTGHTSPSLLSLDEAGTRITLALSLLGTLLSVVVLSTLERLAHARAAAEASRRLAAENQLRLLQSQLEPHMLFNTLANLRVLIGLDAARAQAMLDHLIAFLRATLDASRSATQPLAAEFAQLADYLALMAIRMGPRLQVRLELPPALAALPVPPLLLQPLVENAIKHGLEPKVDGGRIEVGAHRDGQMLRLTVRDTGVGLRVEAARGGSGFGLEQVRGRIAALHGDRASLELIAAPDAEGGTLATLRLPLPA